MSNLMESDTDDASSCSYVLIGPHSRFARNTLKKLDSGRVGCAKTHTPIDCSSLKSEYRANFVSMDDVSRRQIERIIEENRCLAMAMHRRIRGDRVGQLLKQYRPNVEQLASNNNCRVNSSRVTDHVKKLVDKQQQTSPVHSVTYPSQCSSSECAKSRRRIHRKK
ncbi:hypothetical protein ACOME3_008152 [Neoechinorhynchus agilis]